MKRDYVTIGSFIVSIILLVLLIGARNQIIQANRQISNLNNYVYELDSDINYLANRVRSMEDIISQEDIIVSVDKEVEIIDLAEGIGEASITLNVSNVHKDSTVKLVISERERAKYYSQSYVISKEDVEVIEEIAPIVSEEVRTFEVEMDNISAGVYSTTFDVQHGFEYEVFVVLEYDGIIYQEQIDSVYVTDESRVSGYVAIHFSDYKENTDTVELYTTVDITNCNGTELDTAEVILKDGNTVLSRVDLLSGDESIDGETTHCGNYYDLNIETDYVSGASRTIVLYLVDEYGRVSRIEQTIEME